jgi:cell division protein FtsB
MASARSAAARRSASRSAPAGRSRPAVRPRTLATSGIRWDRVGRVAMLMLIGGVLLLYVGPAHSWYVTWRDAHAKRGEVRALRAENQRLSARRAQLLRPATLEREARQLGMVRPGERPYIVQGLSPGR